jgi:hypothetical protein
VTLDPEDDANDDGVGAGEDVSGNCDEAEHANDPECQGGGTADDDDDSGPGGNDDDQGDLDDHDGGDVNDDDNSGPGGGDDHDDD